MWSAASSATDVAPSSHSEAVFDDKSRSASASSVREFILNSFICQSWRHGVRICSINAPNYYTAESENVLSNAVI